MSEWTLERALRLAVTMEKQSIQLYSSAQDRVASPGSKRFLRDLVNEEEGHRSKPLEAIERPEKIGGIGTLVASITDLQIVDRLERTSLSPEAGYQEILIYAAKRELETHDFYLELAKRYRKKEIGNMFIRLAAEELRHKHDLEKEYDDNVLKEM